MKTVTFKHVFHSLLRFILNVVMTLLVVVFFVLAQTTWAGLIYRPAVHVAVFFILLLLFIAASIVSFVLVRKKQLQGRRRWYMTIGIFAVVFCLVAQLFALTQTSSTTLALFLGVVPGQFLIIGGVGLIIAIASFFLHLRRSTVSIGFSSGLMVLGSLIVLTAQLSFASDHSVKVKPQEMLSSEDRITAPSEIKHITVEDKQLAIAIWPARQIQKLQPAIILIHGGGYGSGSALDMKNLGTYLSDRGYPVFSVEYRLAPPQRWADASNDIVAMLQWVRDNGAVYQADANRAVLMGVSAGGGLALNVGYGLKQASVVSSLGGALPAAPIGVAGMYPPADLRGVYNSTEFQNPQPVLNLFTGGTPTAVPSHFDYADPSAKVRPGLMPTFLMTGANDHLIYKQTVTGFADKLRQSGNSVESYVMPFADHSFDVRYNSPASAVERELLLRWLNGVAPLAR